jgi:hypothetical protein
VPRLLEKTVNLEADKTYANLKMVLLEKGCKTKSEQPFKRLLVKQGSLWGMAPKTAKKNMEFTLTQANLATQVTCKSSMSRDWKNITLIGCVLSTVLVGFCGWMAFDLTAFMASGKASFWSWLVNVNGSPDVQVGHSFVNLTLALAVFLSLIILFEVADVVYVQGRIDRFAEETLNSMPK